LNSSDANIEKSKLRLRLLAVAAQLARELALDGLGQVLVGEVGDVFSQDGVDGAGLAALDVQRLLQAGAEAGDDDLVDDGGVLARGLIGGVLSHGGRNAPHQGGGGSAGDTEGADVAEGSCHISLPAPKPVAPVSFVGMLLRIVGRYACHFLQQLPAFCNRLVSASVQDCSEPRKQRRFHKVTEPASRCRRNRKGPGSLRSPFS